MNDCLCWPVITLQGRYTATTMFVLPTSGVGVQMYHLPIVHTKNDGAFWQCLPHFNSFINKVIYLLGNSLQHTPKIAHSWDHLKVPVHLGSWSSGHGLSEGARLGAATESLRSTISTAIYIIVYWLQLHSNSWYLPCWFTTKHACRYCSCVAGSGFIPGYASSIANTKDKQQYAHKITIVGSNPYKICKGEWDNTDMWPSISYVHVCMHTFYNPNLTIRMTLNYKRPGQLQEFPGWMSTGGISWITESYHWKGALDPKCNKINP